MFLIDCSLAPAHHYSALIYAVLLQARLPDKKTASPVQAPEMFPLIEVKRFRSFRTGLYAPILAVRTSFSYGFNSILFSIGKPASSRQGG